MYQMPISTSDNDEASAAVNHHNQSVEHGASDNNNEQQQQMLTQEQQQQHQQQQQQQHLQPSFNLVKLFIKQKSSSTDTCMDVSSGCWPSDSTNSSTGDNNNSNSSNNNNNNNLTSNMTNNQRMRKKSMNDSGKGSALSRHDEEELRRLHEAELRKTDGDADYPYDSLDPQINQAHTADGPKETNDFNREVFDSPSRRQKKNYREFNIIRNQIKNPIVFNLMNNNTSISNNSYRDTTSDTTASRTSENLTQIFNSNSSKAAATTKIPIEMLTKSMQTSTSQFVHTANAVAAANANTKEKYRIVPPSFLAQLNKLGDDQRAPVFVVYPNYALPDLGFLKQQPQQPAEVILSPLSFKEPFAPKKRPTTAKRPFSMNATDNFYLSRREYKHVKDWQSLMTLLPREYRKLLKNIPECQEEAANMMDTSMSSQRPMFCMSPPIRRGCGVGASRPVSCDCVSILTQTNNYSGSSSGESSSQPPSSGYRGSSTLLTDSELDGASGGGLGSNNSLKNMYVYQYEASGGDEGHPMRPPSGRHQRGILRRTNTNIRLPPKGGAGKRNSMFEDPALHGITVAEKRRSLQDPYYMTDTYNIVEDFIAETNAEQVECDQLPVTTGGLPNYPKQRDSDRFNSMKQQLRDFDLNKAVTNKLNADREEMAARMRAENFLTNVPKSELKHYAEVANLLESIIDESKDGAAAFDCGKLRNVVSRALSSQKRVSFDHEDSVAKNGANKLVLRPNELHFTTPPNSPNMSTIHTQAVAGGHKAGVQKLQPVKPKPLNEKEKLDKVACNRFKRLQIQWELLSKESAALAHEMQGNGECDQYQTVRDTKSGGNTPVGHSSAPKSRIPRPVSYPTSK
jgi:iporin